MPKHLLPLLPLALLAACARSEPEEDAPNTDAAVEQPAAPAETTPEPAAEPSPIAQPTADANATAELPPAEEVGPDEQMLDDASATGMTARAEREADEATDPLPANAEEL